MKIEDQNNEKKICTANGNYIYKSKYERAKKRDKEEVYQLILRIPVDLKPEIEKYIHENDISMNEFIKKLFSELDFTEQYIKSNISYACETYMFRARLPKQAQAVLKSFSAANEISLNQLATELVCKKLNIDI